MVRGEKRKEIVAEERKSWEKGERGGCYPLSTRELRRGCLAETIVPFLWSRHVTCGNSS